MLREADLERPTALSKLRSPSRRTASKSNSQEILSQHSTSFSQHTSSSFNNSFNSTNALERLAQEMSDMRQEMRYEIKNLRQEIRGSKIESTEDESLSVLKAFSKVSSVRELEKAEEKFLCHTEESIYHRTQLVRKETNKLYYIKNILLTFFFYHSNTIVFCFSAISQ